MNSKLLGDSRSRKQLKERSIVDPKENPERRFREKTASLMLLEKRLAESMAELVSLNQERDSKLRLAMWGVLTTKVPAQKEIHAKRKELCYVDGALNVAVAGGAGVGKTSLIRSLCKAHFDEVDQTQYRFKNRVCYDIPGVGSDESERIDYFHKRGLYAFDAVIIVTGHRITDLDIAIALQCQKCRVPFIFVRSRSDQLAKGIYDDLEDQDWTKGELECRYKEELERKIDGLRAYVKSCLTEVQQSALEWESNDGFFLVNSRSLRSEVSGKKSGREIVIDEVKLLDYLTSLEPASSFTDVDVDRLPLADGASLAIAQESRFPEPNKASEAVALYTHSTANTPWVGEI